MEAKRFALVYSIKDPAGVLIAESIEELGTPEWAEVYEIEKDIIFADLSKIKEKEIIFLSRHQSEAQTKSLTVHMVGNFSEAKFGGKSNELCGALSRVGANYLRALNEKNISGGLNKQGFVVTLEATHHGPFTNKNCLFIEIGSTPQDWKNKLAAKIIAEVVVNETLKENKDTVVIGLGGGHYAPDFTKLSLRKNYSFGHICPKHHLSDLSKPLLEQMIQKSGATEIILDWKGLKENKQLIVSLCEKSKIPSQRVQNILK
jgi:D-aminoacyl-tRNA deacylase